MTKISDKIKHCVMSISFQERKKKALIRYRQEKDRLQNMNADEIDLEYINMKTEYEHRKNVLSIFMLSIIISVLMGAWKYFYMFIEKVIQYISSYPGSEIEIAKAAFIISVIVILVITVTIFVILIMYTKRMRRVYRYLIMVDEIRNRRNI